MARLARAIQSNKLISADRAAVLDGPRKVGHDSLY
jgi:hypothetical protein